MKNIRYLFLILLLLIVDVMAFSEVARLVRQPSDVAVAFGLLLLAVMIVINFFVVRYSISKFDS
ncbi:hypothetical protein [Botryobacter ruber]|uniref:hypothetical protein n=1 Tax=Botryobacter ruber TaxID=2171629 RepID=UPI000E0A49EA|nr:hypothetical protein [Botryobacter ruber]